MAPFIAANPEFATALQTFQSMPNARLAISTLLGNVLVVLPIPSNGLALDTIGQALTAQFQVVPGVAGKPVAEKMTLPAGAALHWLVTVTANKTGGGTATVQESVYLLVSSEIAVLVEFVVPDGGVTANESAILKTFRFVP